MSIDEAASIADGILQGENVTFTGVTTDSRQIAAGDLFVALRGERFNAHAFVNDCASQGAVAAMIDEPVHTGIPCIKVKHTLTGLQRLAGTWRDRFNIPVIAITGSNGKTTVKEMVGAVLRQAYKNVLITQGNLNNHIGVPLTLLRLNHQHRAAVIEMGMNHAGEIALLTQLTKPAIALVNNAMLAHVAAFDSLSAVARAKGEIFQGLSDEGVAVLNADDANYPHWRALITDHDFIDFGLENRARVRAVYSQGTDRTNVEFKTPRGEFHATLNLLGRHNVMNALAAVAIATVKEIDLQLIKAGLESVFPYPGRLQPVKLTSGMLLLNDSYNANPGSMKAGIDVLARFSGRKRILVAADMGELGDTASQLHANTGKYACDNQIDCFIGFGELMENAVAAFGKDAFHTTELSSLLSLLDAHITAGCVILVKGSRAMQMERVVQALTDNYRAGPG